MNYLLSKIEDLIKVSKDITVRSTLSEADFVHIENSLGVKFSHDFKEINNIFRYDYFLSFEFFNFQGESSYSVFQRTSNLRNNQHLTLNTLVLAEDEVSLVLMKCLGDHEEVYWIDFEDYESYCRNETFIYNPTIFPTFSDFFAYLLDEEEKRRVKE